MNFQTQHFFSLQIENLLVIQGNPNWFRLKSIKSSIAHLHQWSKEKFNFNHLGSKEKPFFQEHKKNNKNNGFKQKQNQNKRLTWRCECEMQFVSVFVCLEWQLVLVFCRLQNLWKISKIYSQLKWFITSEMFETWWISLQQKRNQRNVTGVHCLQCNSFGCAFEIGFRDEILNDWKCVDWMINYFQSNVIGFDLFWEKFQAQKNFVIFKFK